MADNGSSNAVASVAIIILVIIALVIGYYFFIQQGKMSTPNAPSKVEVNVPAPSSGTTTKSTSY